MGADTERNRGNDGPVHGPQALAQALAELLGTARREVRLFASQPPPAVVGAAVVAAALQQFATRHPRNAVRLLVENANQLLRENARFVELARRLPDTVAVREVEDDDRGARDLYAVADRSKHLMQEDIGRDDAVIVAGAPHDTLKLIERFDTAWERGTPLALRTLGL